MKNCRARRRHFSAPRRMAEELENGVATEAAGAAGASPLLDLPEPLLLHILGFLTDARSRHRAALACHRLLAAERATRGPALAGVPVPPARVLSPARPRSSSVSAASAGRMSSVEQ
jgi:hypothetical protein